MKLLRVTEVAEKLACHPGTVWKWSKSDPTFPKMFKLGPRHTAWSDEELDAWLKTKQAEPSPR